MQENVHYDQQITLTYYYSYYIYCIGLFSL